MYMTKPPTQADRVYNALIERGSLIRDDFLGVTIDGHPPIQNLTAEIDRARKKYGIDVIPKKEGKITRWYFASPEEAQKEREKAARKRRRRRGRKPKNDESKLVRETTAVKPFQKRILALKDRAQDAPGSYSTWLTKRKNIVTLAQNAAQTEPMAFWKAAPLDEIGETMEDLIDAYEALGRTISAFDQRMLDEKQVEKIEKMVADTRGRSGGEIANVNSLVQKKRDRYDIDYLL